MKKSTLSLLIILSLLLSLNPMFASQLDSKTNSTDMYTSIPTKTMNVSSTHNSFEEVDKQASTEIKNIKVTGGSIAVNGIVNNNTEKKEFDLAGKLFVSENSKNLVIGSLIDETDNFDVVYFGISTNPEETLIMDITKKSKLISSGYMACIYLQDKISKELSFIEIDPSQFLKKSEIMSLSKRLKKGDHKDQFWYAKVLVPSEMKENVMPEVTEVVSAKKAGDNDSLTVGIMASTYKDVTYSYSYNVAGAIIVESITMRHYIDGPSAISNQGAFVAKLTMVNEKTTCAAVPSMNTTDSNMEIGVYGDTRIDAVTSPGDYLQQVLWGGTYAQSGTLNISCRWSYTLPLVKLGVAVSYTSASTYSSNTYKSFDNVNGTYVRQAGIKWTKAKQRLISVGQNFDTSFTVNKLSTPGSKYFTGQFQYDVSNGLDYTYGGIKTVSVSKSYTCN